MPDLAGLTPLELADLLQAVYAADHELPGEHLTDPVARHDLARLLDHDEALKFAVVEAWLDDREAFEDAALCWFDAEFLGELELPEREED
ncbi:hypothetical protein MF271_22730 (plasmid) [Deinococcus sp. KNUC1210]|uniref:hypothetical protein n=1 Tax=Deinococcus sp. KNUC1210 TaxID=2917691 RepID=UPI001EEFDEA7|nr:hypothetical protein [Deinococcus sp. KNUC1210]ULH18282.1 hypothetical protein MF271_22730 [Deinococcus sp. KNUC1210]